MGIEQDHIDYKCSFGTEKNSWVEVPPSGILGLNLHRLDRDKDKSDLKQCPSGYYNHGYMKYTQLIVADVYLRKCKLIPPA